MELYQINEHIYCLPYDQRSDRPNLFYIKGDNFSVAIDAGNSQQHVQLFYSQLAEKNLPLPAYTIITHWHWDHTFGMCAVAGKTIASQLTNEKLKEVKNWKWTIEDMVAREKSGKDIQFCNENILHEYRDLDDIRVVLADEVVQQERVLDLGGVVLRLIANDSTHSRDSLYILDETDRALFLGDADCEDYYDNYAMYDANRLKQMISFFESLNYDWHLIGHSEEGTKKDNMNYLKGELMKLSMPTMMF